MRQVLHVTWYRYRATFARQLSAYLAVVLLIGLLGGVAMASVAAARRTQSSYPIFLAGTDASTLTMSVFHTAGIGGPGQNIAPAIRRLPDVSHVVSALIPKIAPLTVAGAPRLNTVASINTAGSLDGMMSHQDRLAVFGGRTWDQRRANEIVMTSGAAQQLGYHVGEVIPFGVYTNAQTTFPGFGTPRVKPTLELHLRLVALATFNTQLVQDDIDRTYGFIFMDRALTERLARVVPDQLTPALYGIQLKNGPRGLATVERQLIGLVPRGDIYEFHVTSTVTHEVELAIKPESVALGAFGAIAALACLVLVAQAISRLIRRGDQDRRVMRALGASPRASVIEGVVGALAAVGTGTVLALGVAVLLSPLAPLGPVRAVFPDRGFNADATVLGVGAAVLLVGLSLFTLVRSLREVQRGSARPSLLAGRGAHLSERAPVTLLPVAATVGIHFAVDPGRGRATVPVRSVIGGTILAVAMVVATLTFASGFSTLISRPPLYGWNWNYLLNPSNNVPPAAIAALSHDPSVAAWSGADYTDIEIDNHEVPILMQRVGAKVTPPTLSGHGLRTRHQIVMGAATLALLHKKVGDSVEVSLGSPKNKGYYLAPTKLTIVGTATLPAVGYASFVAEHTAMGTGALLPVNFSHINFSSGGSDPNLNGPELVFVRTRTGVSAAVARAGLDRVARVANQVLNHDKHSVGNSVSVLGVLRPVQIVNYRSVGSTPVLLATGLALGGILALGVTLASSVRRRRRDLALLKTLGFTHRQLSSAIAWQASTTAGVGVLLGVPLGVLIGRELWTLFARSINAVPDPTVPALSVLLVAAGALAFANVVAALPGRSAARTSAALVLRAE
ncbi:MAG TPA: FtsX-like permease family protein [Acidimicrobiales bacterium]|nr:FtsX-like permease family protein [Acidimicrobiales bacterium]